MPSPRLHAGEVDIDGSLVRRLLDEQLPAFAYLHTNPSMVATARRGPEAVPDLG